MGETPANGYTFGKSLGFAVGADGFEGSAILRDEVEIIYTQSFPLGDGEAGNALEGFDSSGDIIRAGRG